MSAATQPKKLAPTNVASRHRPSIVLAQDSAQEVGWSILQPVRGWWRFLTLVLALLAIGAVGVLDYLAGPLVSFTVFYLVCILVIAWLFNLFSTILFSLICTAVQVLGDLWHSNFDATLVQIYWQAAGALAVYLFVGFVVYSFRAVLEREVALARTDPLTGAANNRSFGERANLELNRARRSNRPLTVAYVDVDRFKAVNDRFGHSAGDRLLRTITTTIRANLRNSDMVARLGGDEFALLLPETSYEPAHLGLSRVHSALDAAMNQDKWPVTFSIGIVTFAKVPENIDALIQIADSVMYDAKESGKNTIRHSTWRGEEP